jgi:hypothetical protein
VFHNLTQKMKMQGKIVAENYKLTKKLGAGAGAGAFG